MSIRTKTAIVLGAAALLAPTAAFAEAPNGPRAEVFVGWDNFNGEPMLNSDDVFYGLGVGYDYKVSGKSSIGVDAEISDSEVSKTTELAPQVTANFEAKRDLYIGARYTYALQDRVNLYATAGYTNQRIGGSTSLGESDKTNLDGFRVGAGVQYGLTDRLYLSTSYRYSDYEGGLTRHQAVTGIGFRF